MLLDSADKCWAMAAGGGDGRCGDGSVGRGDGCGVGPLLGLLGRRANRTCRVNG
jgi:hypothetical protein